MFTGYRPSPAIQFPSLGSVVSHEFGPRANLPPYVCIPNQPNIYAGCGYLSSSFSPFNLGADPASGGFKVRDLLARPGEPVHFRLELKDHGTTDTGLAPQDWHNAWASIGGPKRILINRNVPRDWEAKAKKYAEQGKKHGSVVQDPRTAIAFDTQYVYFLVIDGRSKESIGMTFTEAGFFCRDVLQATDAILQDGGGSSTLWVDGKVKNTPSGKGKDEKHGVLRAVSNGYFLAEVLPPKKSGQFRDGQAVRLNGELRLGPGPTFGAAAKVAATDSGTIQPEPLNGILAKGANWIPADSFPARVTAEQMEYLIQSAAAANTPTVSVRRSGNFESIRRSSAYAPKMHKGICQPAMRRRLMTSGR